MQARVRRSREICVSRSGCTVKGLERILDPPLVDAHPTAQLSGAMVVSVEVARESKLKLPTFGARVEAGSHQIKLVRGVVSRTRVLF